MVVIRGVRLWKKRASRDLELCRRTEADTSGKETLKVLPVLNGSLPFVVSLAVGLAVVIQEAALRMDVVKSFPATIFLSICRSQMLVRTSSLCVLEIQGSMHNETTQFNAIVLCTEGQVKQSMPQQTKKQFTVYKGTQ
jgi:hypothetical protein